MTHEYLKGIFVTDTHFRGNNPRSRKDDYYKAVIAKMSWIVERAIDKNVDVILHGGDMFNSPDVGNSVITTAIQCLLPAVEHGIKIIVVHGSHDIWAYNESTIHRSAIGVLEASKLIAILRRGEFIEIDGVAIVGVPHSSNLDGGQGYYYIGEKEHFNKDFYDFTILLAHGTLVDAAKPDDFAYTLIEEARVNADLVLSGDYHPGYAKYVRPRDGVIFANPGSLARTAATANNRVRTPSVVEFEIHKNAPPRVTYVPIACAAEGCNVFVDETPAEPPDDQSIAKLVAFIKSQTEGADSQFNPLELVDRLPAGNFDTEDLPYLEEARECCKRMLQEAVARQV